MRYTLVKILLSLPTLLIVSVVVFALMRLAPGDPAVMLVGDVENTQALEEARRALGLDKPYPVQFWLWLSQLLKGDFGVSLMTGEAVLPAILSRFAVTAQIVVLALLIATTVAVPLGTLAAWRQDRPTDLAVRLAANAMISVPSFWVGLMLILLFGARLGWLPTVGYISVLRNPGEGALYLVLPVAALLLVEIGGLVRMVRASTLDVVRQDFVTNALAKGLSSASVLRRHVVKNAFGPTLTLLGLILGSLLGGVAVIETVFTLPGLGRFLVDAIYARDYAVVQGSLVFVAALHVAVNLVVDLLYPAIDPRVKL